ncbi:fluoride efflux transporter CrcB [Pontibacillus yanchengensis]|uniref:fluoride efflux transporter CrcB n=1 Tax=Pontibacillus yanchengensis TaxID=462910 RepID=UPI001F017105|nr:fluoride efflux transporter CrcB [Pontibacillus yanchengensis]
MSASTYVSVFIGGCIGAVARYTVSIGIDPIFTFPFETLLVNWLGCFLLTYFISHPFLSKRVSEKIMVGVGTGVLGGFTTFSTFSVETIQLWMSQSVLMAMLYVALSIIGGIGLAWLGFKTGRRRVSQA